MKYFKYIHGESLYSMSKINAELTLLRGYAVAKAKSMGLTDADNTLDEAFHHAIHHYEDRGIPVRNYLMRLINTITKGYSKEVSEDTNKIDEFKMGNDEDYVRTNPENIYLDHEERIVKGDLHNCILDLIPKFVRDYKFMRTMKKEDRKEDYSSVIHKYDIYVVKSATEYLSKTYGKAIENLYKRSRECRRRYKTIRYEDYWDRGINYHCMINGILIYSNSSSHPIRKCFYEVNIKDIVTNVILHIYKSPDSTLSLNIDGVGVYCSSSGKIVIGEENLAKELEVEILAVLFDKRYLLVKYTKGVDAILSLTRESMLGDEYISVDGRFVPLELERISARRVQ